MTASSGQSPPRAATSTLFGTRVRWIGLPSIPMAR
ncbi:hypothetical protein LINPERHAP1_LOCUS20328 [Linum perenne]